MSENSRRELFVIDGAVTNNETIIQALGDRDYDSQRKQRAG